MAAELICKVLPFYNLNNFEFKKVLQPPSKRLSEILKDSNFKDHIMNMLKCDVTELNDCQYYTEEGLSKVTEHDNIALSVLNLNIRSMDKHLGELMALIANVNHNFHIIALSEIGSKNVANRLMSIRDRYNAEFVLPNDNRFGGACLLIKKEIAYHTRSDLCLNCDNVEDVWIECAINNQKFVVGSVYRHPGNKPKLFQERLENVTFKIQNETCRAFVCGDFNIDGCKINVNPQTTNFYESLLAQNFIPTISLPTRITEYSITLIDNIFMKIDARKDDTVMAGNIYSDISDHLPNFVIIKNTKKGKFQPKNRPKLRLFGEKNFNKFKNIMEECNWNNMYDTCDVNEMVERFYAH